MQSRPARTALAVLVSARVLAGAAARADEQHHHHPAGEKLGTVKFPVSCAPAVLEDFSRATALLHSFAYAEAENAYASIAGKDPSCAMAHWGVAMTQFHPIWAAANVAAAPSPAEIQKGRAAVEKARAGAAALTPREKDYIAAVEAFYAGEVPYPARAQAFAKAMEGVQARHPQDAEAAIFHALALLGTAPPDDKTYAIQKRAAEILNRVLPEAPEHPGVAHYVIHSFDYPALAELALPAARAYAKIAPSAPHALHMPSHIFVRLGLWEDSIASNRDSAETARRWVARSHPGASSFDELHAYDYLAYAYLQVGRDAEARAILDAVSRVETLDVPQFAAAYALAAVPARLALERRDWTAAQAVGLRPASFPWERFLNAQAIVEFARALGGARGGDLVVARKALARLEELKAGLLSRNDRFWAGHVDVQRQAAAAWIALAEGRRDEALRLSRAAADLEDATEKHPVTPGSVLPARELLADMLLETGDGKAALAEYELSLQTAPGRYNSLFGALVAAGKAGDPARERAHAARLVEQCGKADASRVELTKARAVLAAGR